MGNDTEVEQCPRAHADWAGVADAWGQHAAYADARGKVVTDLMLERTAPSVGDRVLELACGPGGAGLAAAPLVGPEGEVVLSDGVAEMAAIAGRRAVDLGLDNVTTAVRELDRIDEADASFDVVLCREGLMFAADPARSVAEIARVLRPGGRMAIAVWGPRDRNPWLGLVFDALGAQLGMALPPPGVPSPFALDDPDRVLALFAGTRLVGADLVEVPTPLVDASFDAWWTRTASLAGPLSGLLAALPDEARVELRERVATAVAPYRQGEGLSFPGVTLLASAQRASS